MKSFTVFANVSLAKWFDGLKKVPELISISVKYDIVSSYIQMSSTPMTNYNILLLLQPYTYLQKKNHVKLANVIQQNYT